MGLFTKLNWSNDKRFTYLLISLILFILLPPFLVELIILKYAIILLLVNVLVISTIVITTGSKVERYDFILFIGLLIVSIIDDTKNIPLEVIRSLVLLVFFVLTVRRLILYILKIEKVTEGVIVGAVSAYLLMGLAGAVLINLIELIYPNSFNISSDYHNFYNMTYYSFVTLSTLGYGDIVPQTPQAKSVAMALSIFGQLYLAILMAMLVSKFLSDKRDEGRNKDV